MNASTVGARKRADLISVTGAAIAGAAVGAWLATPLRPWAALLLIVGLLSHAVGMTARHRLDRSSGPLPRVWIALYAVCWIAIATTLVGLVVRIWIHPA